MRINGLSSLKFKFQDCHSIILSYASTRALENQIVCQKLQHSMTHRGESCQLDCQVAACVTYKRVLIISILMCGFSKQHKADNRLNICIRCIIVIVITKIQTDSLHKICYINAEQFQTGADLIMNLRGFQHFKLSSFCAPRAITAMQAECNYYLFSSC